MSQADRFLKACHRESTDCTPIWLINQYGRYLNEYRELRQKYDFMEMIKTPEIAADITVLPVEKLGVDAAILFSDILPFLESMGMQLDFSNGASITNPLRNHADIESLVMPGLDALEFTGSAIGIAVEKLEGRAPVIGFAGAPFTLACYAVEGGNSMFFYRVKEMMYSDTAWWHKLMDKFTGCLADYISAQVTAGAQAVQLFDSFIGILSPYDFREYVLPHMQRLMKRLSDSCPSVPIIYYGSDCSGFLSLMSEIGTQVVSLDWKTDLPEAWETLGKDIAVQGNLDPALLLGPEDEMKRQVARTLDALRGRPGHIMNLGHAIAGTTNPESVKALVDFVHTYSQADDE